jgi:hypothetical protein
MDHAHGLIGKALKALLGTPPYFGHVDAKPISHAESVAIEAENSPKSVVQLQGGKGAQERSRHRALATRDLRIGDEHGNRTH